MTSQQGSVTLIINIGGANNSQGGSGAEVNSLTLPITPEDIQITRPSRQAVTQTLTGAYQDHLGSGITTVSMRGHTGWRNLTPEGDGYNVIKRLRDLLGQYDKIVATDRPDRVSLMLLLSLPSGWEHFRVSKTTVSYTRSRAQPLLYRYEAQFIVLHDFNDATGQVDPSPNFVINQGIFPNVQLVQVPISLPDSSTSSSTGSSGDASGIIGDQARDTNDPRLEQPQTGTTSPTAAPITLAAFTDQQYPPVNGYPPGMYNYIIAANPDFFYQSDIDPNVYMLVPGTTLNILQISIADVYHYSSHGKVTSKDVYALNGSIIIGGQLHYLPSNKVTIPGEGEYRGWDTSDGGGGGGRRF